MDPHKNIFYYYRGQSGSEKLRSNQIEDNATKSLINLLENGGSIIQKAFFDMLNIKKSALPRFKLQQGQENSRPDAIIDFPKERILIEVKVKASLDVEQLKRHLTPYIKNQNDKDVHLLVLTDNESDEKLIGGLEVNLRSMVLFKTWKEVYVNLKRVKPKTDKEEFLLKQFLDYLELMNMKPFTEFTKDDFDYFYDMDSDYGQVIKEKLKQLAEGIKEKSEVMDIMQDYSEIKQGNIDKKVHLDNRDKDIWVAFSNPNDKSKFKNSNFCITFASEYVRLSLVLSGQRCTVKNHPIERFYDYLGDEQKALKLFKKLKGMTTFIYERTDGKGKSPRIGADSWEKKVIIENKFLKTKGDIQFIKSLLEKIEFPGINMSVIYPKSKVIENLDKEKLVKDMVKNLPVMYEVLMGIKEHK